mgnify:FL=1
MKKSSSTLKNSITSIAIGGFDGMHIAHQELFKNLDSNGGILSIESSYANLTPKKYRQEYSKYPIFYYQLEEIKHLEGDEFIRLLEKEFPNLKKVVVGFDFCFGKDRKYCIQKLKELFKGEVIILDEIKLENIAVHSRVIREYIKNGDIKNANKFLGKNYKIYGNHITGQGLGSTDFVPTINLTVKEFLLPKEGVYITKTILNEKEYSSVTFLGHRVTTDGSYAIETHILEPFTQNEDEGIIQIKFLEKIRDNKKFDNFTELKNEILKDIETAKKYFINVY